ncbi:hypothetical protein VULLAG_LOCUS23080 [Vulpes lagopus]
MTFRKPPELSKSHTVRDNTTPRFVALSTCLGVSSERLRSPPQLPPNPLGCQLGHRPVLYTEDTDPHAPHKGYRPAPSAQTPQTCILHKVIGPQQPLPPDSEGQSTSFEDIRKGAPLLGDILRTGSQSRKDLSCCPVCCIGEAAVPATPGNTYAPRESYRDT